MTPRDKEKRQGLIWLMRRGPRIALLCVIALVIGLGLLFPIDAPLAQELDKRFADIDAFVHRAVYISVFS